MTFHDTPLSAGRRPGVVTTVIVLAYVAAVWNFGQGVVLLLVALRPGTVSGMAYSVSDWYWVTLAILDMIVGVIYVVIARGLAAADPPSRNLAILLAVISGFFALLALPYGLVALVLSALVIILLSGQPAKTYFGVA